METHCIGLENLYIREVSKPWPLGRCPTGEWPDRSFYTGQQPHHCPTSKLENAIIPAQYPSAFSMPIVPKLG